MRYGESRVKHRHVTFDPERFTNDCVNPKIAVPICQYHLNTLIQNGFPAGAVWGENPRSSGHNSCCGENCWDKAVKYVDLTERGTNDS